MALASAEQAHKAGFGWLVWEWRCVDSLKILPLVHALLNLLCGTARDPNGFVALVDRG